jgi:hypothetical protein
MCDVLHKKLDCYINSFHFHVQQFNVEHFILKKRKRKIKNITIVGDKKMAFKVCIHPLHPPIVWNALIN